MRHVPWITIIVTAVFFASWYGQSLLHEAFVSGEGLANSLSKFLLLCVLGIVATLALLEWTIKYYIRRRRARKATNTIQS
jgi:hypothetical protein